VAEKEEKKRRFLALGSLTSLREKTEEAPAATNDIPCFKTYYLSGIPEEGVWVRLKNNFTF